MPIDFRSAEEKDKDRRCPKTSEHLQRVLSGFNHQALPSVPLRFKSKLPVLCCVYVAYVNDDIYYIGKTQNLKQRWQGHSPHLLARLRESEQLCFPALARIGWQEVDASILDLTESSLIQHCFPLMNVSENYRYSFEEL